MSYLDSNSYNEYQEYGHLDTVDLEQLAREFYYNNIDVPEEDHFEDLG